MSIEANIIVKLKYTYRQHKSTALDRHIDSVHRKILVCLYLRAEGYACFRIISQICCSIYGKHAVYSYGCIIFWNMYCCFGRKHRSHSTSEEVHWYTAIEYVKDKTADFDDIIIHLLRMYFNTYGREKDYLISNLLHPIIFKSV